MEKGIYKADVELTQEFVNQFCLRIANLMSRQFNRNDNVLEAETDTLRISIIHPKKRYLINVIDSRERKTLYDKRTTDSSGKYLPENDGYHLS